MMQPSPAPDPSVPTDWMAAGACKGKTDLFFPPSGGYPGAEAAAVCAGCPVRQACDDYATTTGARGFWAGRQRRGPA